MTRKTLTFSLMIALVALATLTAMAATEGPSPQAVSTVQAAPAVTLDPTGQNLNLAQASQIRLSSCSRAECFQELLLCEADCAFLPPNDQPLCEEACTAQFFSCIASCP